MESKAGMMVVAQALAWQTPQLPSTSSTAGCCSCLPNTLSFSHSLSLSSRSAFREVRLGTGNSGNKARRRLGMKYVCSLAAEYRNTASKESIVSVAPDKREKRTPTLKQLILKPPLSDNRLAERFLESPQMQLKSFPLLSSCLPLQSLKKEDEEWMDEHLLEVKNVLGYDMEVLEPKEDSPESHLDLLLFLAFNHKQTPRGHTKWVGIAHSRLAFLGQYVVELALCELFLQMYPRERVGEVRERVFNLTSRKVLPYFFGQASLDELIFVTEESETLHRSEKQMIIRDVFWAVVGALYLTLGMSEVHRFLFEVLRMDVDAPTAQPRERSSLKDEDHVSPDLETRKTWKDIISFKPPEDSLFPSPWLFRSCVPPGMHRFRKNKWELISLSAVKQTLGYPRQVPGSSLEMTEARNVELDLGLQLAFLHPSLYKGHHPRFCFDRLEYLGSKIKDVVGAEQLLMKHLDSPQTWLESKHRLQFMNRLCGRTLRAKKLHDHIIYAEERKDQFEGNRRLRNFATASVSHAIHGLGYIVYGRSEVRRLMYKVFPLDEFLHPKYL